MTRLPGWSDSYISILLSSVPRKDNAWVWASATDLCRELIEDGYTDSELIALASELTIDHLTSCDQGSLKWSNLTEEQEDHLVEVVACYALLPFGQRVGNRVLQVQRPTPKTYYIGGFYFGSR